MSEICLALLEICLALLEICLALLEICLALLEIGEALLDVRLESALSFLKVKERRLDLCKNWGMVAELEWIIEEYADRIRDKVVVVCHCKVLGCE